MKKLLSVLLALACVFCLMSGCAQKSDKVRIGIAAPDVTHGWVAAVAYHAEKYCSENNIEYKIVTSSDAAEMATAIDDLLAWGATAIVTYPQWTGMESKIDEVVAGGTPVVSFDIDIDSEGIYKVTGDNYGMGEKCAEYIASKVDSGAVIVILDVPRSGSVATLRKQGFYEKLAALDFDTANVIEVECESFTRAEGISVMSDVLTANSHIDAVYSFDDELSIGVIQAIEEAGRDDVRVVTGGGGMQEYFRMIADDASSSLSLCTALYSPAMVEDAVKNAVELSRGNKDIDTLQVVPTTIVSSENAADYLDPENTVY